MHGARHGGCPRARGQVRWLHSSGTGGPFPARVGSFGSPCAAHAHTRARAHARVRPRCTLQHTFPQHCTSTTTAHFCTCKLTCALRSGASGRGGLYWARHGWAAPISDTASRCEAYNHLNKRQQSALQWSCILLTRALPGSGRRAEAPATPFSRFDGRGSGAPARERSPAPRERARCTNLLKLLCCTCAVVVL